MLFSEGRVYTTTGLVIDAEGKQVIGSVQAQGPMAVDGNRVYWLDPSVAMTQVALVPNFDHFTWTPATLRELIEGPLALPIPKSANEEMVWVSDTQNGGVWLAVYPVPEGCAVN